MKKNMNLKNKIRKAVVKKSVMVLLSVYDEIASSKSVFTKLPNEDQRRNQIVDFIRRNNKKYNFKYHISTESGEYDGCFNTIGRIDICIFYNLSKFEGETVAFECKSFKKSNSNPASVKTTFYDNGIHRFENGKYACKAGIGGMIAFCEEGSFPKLNSNIKNVLINTTENVLDLEESYDHQYIYISKLKNVATNIEVLSILMNFT